LRGQKVIQRAAFAPLLEATDISGPVSWGRGFSNYFFDYPASVLDVFCFQCRVDKEHEAALAQFLGHRQTRLAPPFHQEGLFSVCVVAAANRAWHAFRTDCLKNPIATPARP
jgi:hypothetical protein